MKSRVQGVNFFVLDALGVEKAVCLGLYGRGEVEEGCYNTSFQGISRKALRKSVI